MLNSKATAYSLRTLSDSIANCLYQGLESFLKKVGLLRSLPNGIPYQEETVYDLLNCGPRKRFVVLGTEPVLVSNCQSTGHDCTVLWIVTYSRMLNEAGIEWQPWIADFHDESIIAVREDQAEAAKEILERTSADAVNRLLNGKIPLKLVGSITDNLADIKLED